MSTADDHRTYSIRQLCREFGATARALRFYEDKGLLTPARKGQTRVYDARDRARLKLILRGRRIGFTLQEIQDMLDLYDNKDGNVHQMAIALRRHGGPADRNPARPSARRRGIRLGAARTPRPTRPSSVQAESLTPWPTRRLSAT